MDYHGRIQQRTDAALICGVAVAIGFVLFAGLLAAALVAISIGSFVALAADGVRIWRGRFAEALGAQRRPQARARDGASYKPRAARSGRRSFNGERTMDNLHPAIARALAPFAPAGGAARAKRSAPSVIDVLVEDVRYRARRHGFVVADFENALELARQSAVTLSLKVSEEEIRLAASRLIAIARGVERGPREAVLHPASPWAR